MCAQTCTRRGLYVSYNQRLYSYTFVSTFYTLEKSIVSRSRDVPVTGRHVSPNHGIFSLARFLKQYVIVVNKSCIH